MRQRAFRRFLAMRAAKIQMAIEQWNWFEPRRVLRLERRKMQKGQREEAAANAGGGVKFGIKFAGAEREKSEFDLGTARRGSAEVTPFNVGNASRRASSF